MTGKKRSIALWLLGVLLICTMLSAAVSAQDGGQNYLPGMTMEGTKLTLGDSAFSPDYGVAPHGEYLASGGCSITRTEHYIATIDGYTGAYTTCDELYLGLYMDRLEKDGTWHTVYSKEVTGEDCYHLAYSTKVFVKPGYYYRMRAGHIARFEDIMESNISATDGIYFGEGGDY